jgi:hypothetical protein
MAIRVNMRVTWMTPAMYPTVLVVWNIPMDESMKENGTMANGTALVEPFFLIATVIKVNTIKINDMVLGPMLGATDAVIKVNLSRINVMGRVCIRGQMEPSMKAILARDCGMVEVPTPFGMEVSMTENGNVANIMDREFVDGPMDAPMKERGSPAKLRVWEGKQDRMGRSDTTACGNMIDQYATRIVTEKRKRVLEWSRPQRGNY